jgi:Tfp pilus assembly protein PilV
MRGRARGGAEAGETLIETMVTVFVLGISMVALLGAIWTTLRISDSTTKNTNTDAALRSFAEAMKQGDPTATYHYVACTTAGGQVTYPAYTPPAPFADYRATITKIQYLSGYSAANEPQWADSCPATDLGLQQITLQMQGPANDTQTAGKESVTVVKRNATQDVEVGSV